jgi:3-phenylpropionate/trans-cinnamate dioxygenase ferredoxin reductase component
LHRTDDKKDQNIMTKYKYLIIGGGMTAAAAADGIRTVDATGGIGLISAELDSPYDRPPLTKGLWKGKALDTIWRKTGSKEVTMHLGRVVKAIVPAEKRVVDDRGVAFTYDKLLLATGGRPRVLPFGGEEIIYFRTVADYRRLRALTEKARRFAVIGGGFIGAEIAASLASIGMKVVMIFPGKGIGGHIFPEALSQFITTYYEQKGVELVRGEKIEGLTARGNQHVLKTATNREIVVDGVVAGVGIEPNVELARSIGLEVENGIIVDELLRTSHPDIYAAGDAAAFYNPSLAKRIRVEHEDNANTMGLLAGRNMAGGSEPYRHLPFFYSDLFELGYEAVGEVDSRLETFADWKEPNKEGVIYYLKANRVSGVLLWNVWGQVDAARALIAEAGPFTAGNLKGRLPVQTSDAKL